MSNTPKPGKISASFLDFSERTNFHDHMINRGAGFWKTEMKDMAAAGITDVVVARAVLAGRAHYHSAMLEEWVEEDQLAAVMQGAEEQGIGMYLGLDLNLFFWDADRDFSRMMKRDLELNRYILAELLAAHGRSPALKGIYVTHEPDRDNVATPERAGALQDFLGAMYTLVKETCGLPVFCSPFFSKSMPPAELAAWWDRFVDRPMFDIIAMQDGIGCAAQRFISPDDIPPLYRELAPVFHSKKIEFWNNVETFILAVRGEPLTPAPLDRIDSQYEAGRPLVARSITWEYTHFLGRQLVGEERYRAFRTWNRLPTVSGQV